MLFCCVARNILVGDSGELCGGPKLCALVASTGGGLNCGGLVNPCAAAASDGFGGPRFEGIMPMGTMPGPGIPIYGL